ncbi:AAA family ATPase [Halocella sp. SP3-1]|uniref:AAA family ATPase n=1 Tax=Halocella sp. SP3-1 TaxID=2382161 RepID=UPI000F753C71|nr:AAA family ATPase [Halocella sp. SP3-1]AZO93467.1 AAA family ATPase [Halocella sp. SP3-1]
MKIPYGISDFKSLRKESYLYVDKTDYISSLEEIGSKYLFFIRPRRFGKSLFLSTLINYYDLNNKEEFDELFGELYIGENPTELKTSYLILQLDFSGLNTDSKEKLYLSFKERLRQTITSNLKKYSNIFEDYHTVINKLENLEDISSILNFYIEKVKESGQKVYLIIDEYDHFANDIIAMGDSDFYKEVIRATGFVRDFYETVKIGSKEVIDRVFITGISPVMLDDLTSGFNIASNITMNKLFNEMLGFTEKEVRGIIKKLAIDIDLNKEELLFELRKNYNGYLFNKDSRERVYNPDMVLHFFSQWLMTGDYPDQLIDDNVRTDYGRLNRLVANEANREVLEDIIMEEGIVANIITRFSFDMMYDEDYFVSLLYYMGLLTIGEIRYGKTRLEIPNHVTRVIFWEYFERRLKNQYQISYDVEEMAKSIWQMGFDGEIKPFLSYISENVLQKLSNRDLINFDEKYIKLVLFSYLVTSNLYRPVSETEVENGYIDIYLERDIRMPDVKYEWIIELKYLKKSERDKLAEVKREGLKQLERYAASRKFEDKDNIKQALIIFIGKDEYELIV